MASYNYYFKKTNQGPRSASRLLRCLGVASLSVITYLKRNLASVDYISTAMRTHNPNLLLRSEMSRLDSLPPDSVDRVAFVTFSYVKHDDSHRLFDFLLPAVDTWAAAPVTPTAPSESMSNDANSNNSTNITRIDADRGNENNNHADTDDDIVMTPSLYVVFSQTSREPYEKLCIYGEGNITTYQHNLCHRIQPIFVDCPEGRFGESPCCKQNNGLLQLFQSRNYPLYDWYAFFDDDTYLQKEYIAKVLVALQVPPDFPMAAVPYNQNPKPIGFKGRMCGTKGMDQFLYPWGMPIFYSRGAMNLTAGGLRGHALFEQCLAFRVTHDVGNAIMNWMYSLPVARLPPVNPLPHFRRDFIGSHWAGRDDVRSTIFGEEKKERRTGKVVKALPEGAFSFYKTHERWMLRHNRPPDVNELATVREEEMKWYPNVTGFNQTRTYFEYGDPRSWREGEWHIMRHKDCDVEPQ